MKKIVLLCAGGLSTSILVNKMKTSAKESGYEYDIDAFSIDAVVAVAKDADCILVAPQASHRIKEISEYVDCPIGDIDMMVYGMMDGQKALEQARKLMGEE